MQIIFYVDNLKEVKIFLAKTLVFENVNEYTLTLQVRNSPDLVAEAQLIIKVKDVNNLVSIVLVVYPYIFLYLTIMKLCLFFARKFNFKY